MRIVCVALVPILCSASYRAGVGDAAYCTWCGKTAPDGAPPTWTVQTSERGMQVLCEECTRANLRSIEANLGTDYW